MPSKPHFFASHSFERMAHRRGQDVWLEPIRRSGKSQPPWPETADWLRK
ncbi:MAG: hypothetical protein IIA05_08775 [Proteobacteria bacterium]|nr:hypothetical protein [Pseudomonadota bacterium]